MSEKDFRESIRENAESYGSIPFWSWNDKLEDDRLRSQIRDMHRLGMHGFFMHARGGLETEYLSDDWFRCVMTCIDEAKKLGMEAWSYDENGWPSGFGGGKLLEDKRNHTVGISYKFAPAESLSAPADAPTVADVPRRDVIAVYSKNPDSSFTLIADERDNLAALNDHTKNNPGENLLILYRIFDSSYVDVLDDEITEKFIQATHEEYRRRIPAEDFGEGKAMPGFFTDEPQYFRWGNPFSLKLPAEFERTYSYPIYDSLPAVFFDFDGADKFRFDYYYLIHKLFITNFVKKIYDRLGEMGASLTGHGVEESSLGGQMMCCGGIMPFYEYETVPGIDYLCRTLSDDIAAKQLGSAAAQTGKKKAISEMFGCAGWDVSPLELKKIAELQYACGVNVMCQHLYPYSERGQRKRDYPLHYSEHNPWQDDMVLFDHYFNNLGAALSRGHEYAPVLVVHPIHGAYCKYKKGTDSLHEIEEKFFELSRALASDLVPYHYGDEWMMSRLASVNGDKLRVGECEYSFVILPFTYSIDSSTVSLLREYCAGGGKIAIPYGLPQYVDGLERDDLLDFIKDAAVPCERARELCDVTLEFTRESDKRVFGNDDVGGIVTMRKMSRVIESSDSVTRAVYLLNPGKETEKVKICLNLDSPAHRVMKLDITTLDYVPVDVDYSNDGLSATVDYIFGEGESVLLVSSPDLPEVTSELQTPVFARRSEFIQIPDTLAVSDKPLNILTLDTASMSKDGESFSETLPIECIRDTLLSERYKGKLWLKFDFTCDCVPEDVRVAVEPFYKSAFINGVEIFPDKSKPWFDPSFATADISSLLTLGKNTLTLEIDYFQRDYVYYVLYCGVSESLRNCLNFDTEIECPYLVGSFGVKCVGAFNSEPHSALRFAPTDEVKFRLTELPNKVDPRNLVESGFPFFGGKLCLTFDYDYEPGAPTVLSLDGRFATAEITVNGKRAAHMLFEKIADLGCFLTPGKNVITMTVSTAMRNTLGPHHRSEAEPYGVGPGTFSFEREWHDKICPSYDPRYAFIKFSVIK